jgi:hypothetical protein
VKVRYISAEDQRLYARLLDLVQQYQQTYSEAVMLEMLEILEPFVRIRVQRMYRSRGLKASPVLDIDDLYQDATTSICREALQHAHTSGRLSVRWFCRTIIMDIKHAYHDIHLQGKQQSPVDYLVEEEDEEKEEPQEQGLERMNCRPSLHTALDLYIHTVGK